MSDRYLHPDPAYLRAIAARDPFAAYLYARSLRSAYVGAKASALLRFVWRHIKQRFKASLQSTSGGEPLLPAKPASAEQRQEMNGLEIPRAFATQRATEETKPAFIAWIANMFRRKRTSVERYPLTPTTKALIANLMAMR